MKITEAKSKLKQIIIIAILLLMFAALSTLPAFFPYRLRISWDGMLHMGRFMQVATSLRHGALPAMISLYGDSNNLNAMVGMYPWLADLPLILPLMLFKHSYLALAVGYLLMNLIAAINIFWLMTFYTKNNYYRFLGVSLYLFNGYHIIDNYVRLAWGELTAYAFLPLVLLGLLYIWQYRKSGKYILAFAMLSIANAHILTLILIVITLAVIELVRLLMRKLDWREFKDLVIAAILGFLGSAYSILNVLYLVSNNNLKQPDRSFIQVDLNSSFNDLVANSYHEQAIYWNLGMVMLGMIIFLLIKMISNKSNTLSKWNYYEIGALISLLVIYNYVPVFRNNHLLTKYLGILQMTGRLFVFTIFMTIIAFVLYCSEYKLHTSRVVILICMTLLMGMSSIAKYNHSDDINRTPISSHTWTRVISSNDLEFHDYLPSNYEIHNQYLSQARVKRISSANDNATFSISSNHSGYHTLPLAFYHGVNYKLSVNGRIQNVRHSGPYLIARLDKGKSKLTVYSSVGHIWYGIFLITLITDIIVLIMMFIGSKVSD